MGNATQPAPRATLLAPARTRRLMSASGWLSGWLAG